MFLEVKSAFGETPKCFNYHEGLDQRTFKKEKNNIPCSHGRCVMILQRHTSHSELSSGITE